MILEIQSQCRLDRRSSDALLNVIGDPIDQNGRYQNLIKDIQSIRSAPAYEELSTSTEMFETGIKVIDLLEPYSKGGKTGLFGGAGVGKTVIDHGIDS